MEGIPCTMYFNPRSPHGERPTASGDVAQPLKISIHAPRTGSDPQTLMDFTPVPFQSTLPARGATPGRQWRSSARRISIHAPRTGSDGSAGGSRGIGCLFQSTLPARGATYSLGLLPRILSFQSTLPARGATKHPNSLANLKKDFNPRSPHGERRVPALIWKPCDNFNPRSPHGERRGGVDSAVSIAAISIHAPRTGSDLAFCGFLPVQTRISIHAPRTGSDGYRRAWRRVQANFNPRSPHGERHGRAGRRTVQPGISIHAPRTGSDRHRRGWATDSHHISIHAPRTGSDTT